MPTQVRTVAGHDAALRAVTASTQADEDIDRLLTARETGSLRDFGDLAARSGPRTAALERQAWADACQSLEDACATR